MGKKTDNAINILTALKFKGVGNAWIYNNLKGGESPEVIIKILNEKKIPVTLSGFNYKRDEVRDVLNNMYKQVDGFGVTAWGDDDFPKITGKIPPADHPVVLFYKGDISLIENPNNNVAMIGVLTPLGDVEHREREVVKHFVNKGVTIVSGLALGCDSIAHDETLKNNGKTVAVLPSPLNDIMPKSNLRLANEILESGGLLVTEYYEPISSKYELSSRYIKRDRLQAMFSKCVVLAASYAENREGKDCGSRHALKKAKDYGISRAVIYDEATDKGNDMFDLSRQIIKEGGAIVIKNDNIVTVVNSVCQIKKANQKSLF
ncbi:MAG: DNA-protecting protein DprA [Bacteroidales bacterium]|nr:DNA-protecting protein DprA [Bacteroidales bacterium]